MVLEFVFAVYLGAIKLSTLITPTLEIHHHPLDCTSVFLPPAGCIHLRGVNKARWEAKGLPMRGEGLMMIYDKPSYMMIVMMINYDYHWD